MSHFTIDIAKHLIWLDRNFWVIQLHFVSNKSYFLKESLTCSSKNQQQSAKCPFLKKYKQATKQYVKSNLFCWSLRRFSLSKSNTITIFHRTTQGWHRSFCFWNCKSSGTV